MRGYSGRLYDAAFFWKEDLQKSLDDLLQGEIDNLSEQLDESTTRSEDEKLALWLTERFLS